MEEASHLVFPYGVLISAMDVYFANWHERAIYILWNHCSLGKVSILKTQFKKKWLIYVDLTQFYGGLYWKTVPFAAI